MNVELNCFRIAIVDLFSDTFLEHVYKAIGWYELWSDA